MNNLGKKIGLGLLVVLVVIQFIRPVKNQDANVSDKDISKVVQVPDNVSSILKKACNDCHSNYTVYPWYSNIQPVYFWLDHHIDEGKHHLNFSEFGTYSAFRQYRKLAEVAEQIEECEMPISSYTLIHKNAVLSADEKKIIVDWAKANSESILKSIPPDVLEQEKAKRRKRQ